MVGILQQVFPWLFEGPRTGDLSSDNDSTLTMRLTAGLVSYLLFLSDTCTAGSTLLKRDADFESVRTHLQHSYQKLEPESPAKYFHESTFHIHYDGRFANKPLRNEDRRDRLTGLMRTYISFMRGIGAETWLMHGTLLGWWWNRRILPWDSDLDVLVSEKSIDHMAAYYNMTVHKFHYGDGELVCSYLLEVNPHYWNGTVDLDNKIDARWIDMDYGLFIDITTLRRNMTARAEGNADAVMVKDKHHYLYDDIYPLRETSFEGVPVKIPYAYVDILIEEYGADALSMVAYQAHRFDATMREWVVDTTPARRPSQMGFWERLQYDWFS